MTLRESVRFALHWLVNRLLIPAHNGWLWLREWLVTLKPCRFSLLMVLAVLAFLILAAQGQDVLRALAERQTGHRDEWQRIFFFGAVLAWAVYAWYWARIMLKLRFPGVPGPDPRRQGLRTWAPRLIGFLATLGVAYAFHQASSEYAATDNSEVRELLGRYALGCLAGAFAFLIAVSLRRPLTRAAYRKLKDLPVMQRRLAAPVLGVLDVRASTEEVYGALNFSDLTPLTRWLLGLALAVAALLFGLFVFALQDSAPALGAAAILLFAATGWIAAGSVLDFVGMRLRYPLFLTLLALAMLFSLWNDNHRVRTLKEPPALETMRDDLRDALRAWLARQQYRLVDGQDRYPLYLVNAEGGGIRAAYWTATVLGKIQNDNPCFADQLFALSGVSGGSLGSAVFVALLGEQRTAGGAFRCGLGAPAGLLDIKGKAQAILGEDFLAPVVAAMLYPDLLQRVLWFPVERFDRARALEEAWERAWRKHMPGTNRFAEPFDRLWSDRTLWTPALFLNATWVETGKRFITSNIRLAPRDGGGSRDFVDIEDGQRFFLPESLALSTAVHLSARFTYVSPAGTLVKAGRAHGRVVDGGYFENSGATTTIEILKTIDLLASDDRPDNLWKKVEPIVIHISNEPIDPEADPPTLVHAPDHAAIAPRRWLNEARSPLAAMLNTRTARGVYARDSVMWHVGKSNFLHFGLCRRGTNIPLGWVLSRHTRERMERQLDTERCLSTDPSPEVIFDNPGNLRRIAARLEQRAAGARRRADGQALLTR